MSLGLLLLISFPLIHLLQPVMRKAFTTGLPMSSTLEELCAEEFESSKCIVCQANNRLGKYKLVVVVKRKLCYQRKKKHKKLYFTTVFYGYIDCQVGDSDNFFI